MPPLIDVGGHKLIRTGGPERLAQTGAMDDAAGADPGSDTDPLQTFDLVDLDDIKPIQHTNLDRLPRQL